MFEPDESRYHASEELADDEAYYAQETVRMKDAYRVRGRMIPLFGIFTSLLFCLLIPVWHTVFSHEIESMAVLIFGVLTSLLAIPCHLLGGSRDVIRIGWVKSLLYIAGILINAAGTSLCIAAYYVRIEHEPTHGRLLLGFLVPAVLFVLVSLLIHASPDRYGLWTGLTCLLTLLLMIFSIVFWGKGESKVLFSFTFFDLLWTLIAIIALHVACSEEESPWLRFSSFASFGVLLGGGVIVLIILLCLGGGGDCDCGGDCCDCGDCGCGGGEGKNASASKPRRKRRHLGM